MWPSGAVRHRTVFTSGSVALLADTIHNFGDAATAIPLWIAFTLVRRKPTATFNYGLGRVEDLAGMLIVLIVLFSALVAVYEAIDRLMNPQPITQLLAVAIAGVIGFTGNEAVAVFVWQSARAVITRSLDGVEPGITDQICASARARDSDHPVRHRRCVRDAVCRATATASMTIN